LVGESESVRRTAALALGLMTALVLVCGVVIVVLVRSEQTANRLNTLAERWSASVQELEVLSARLLDSEYRSSVPPALLVGYEAQIRDHLEDTQATSLEIDAAIEDARSPFVSWSSVIDDGTLAEYEHSELNNSLLMAVGDIPARIGQGDKATPGRGPSELDDANLRVALEGKELSEPAIQREVLGQELADDGRTRFIGSLTVMLAVVIIGLALAWATAFWPALNSLGRLTRALDLHAEEIAHSYLTITAAQRVAKMGYWHRRGEDGEVHCSPELVALAKRDPTESPRTLSDLAGLSTAPTAVAALAEYERLASEVGTSEFTRAIVRSDADLLMVRERVESIEADGSLDQIGIMFDVSEITTAQQVIHRMERLEMVDLLVSGIAHDFNNLLAIVLGNAEVARLKVGEAQERHLDSIVAACETASSLIEQLRHTTVEPTGSFDQFLPAASVLKMAEAIHAPAGVSVVTVVDPGAETAVIAANRGLFESSLVNVVDNSFDALAATGGRVSITVSREDPLGDLDSRGESLGLDASHGVVVIEVGDDGPGMSEEVRRRALQPFFSTRSDGDGSHSGLGLWSVFAFTRSSGGDISIRSAPGQGTVVRLLFPCSPMSGAASSPEPPLQLEVGGTALLVEDDAGLRELIAELLEAYGVEVQVCAGYEEAAERIATLRDLRLLITDVHLGAGPTGIDLARNVLASDRPPGVVLISGAQRFVETPAELRGERCWFVQKPCTAEELRRAIAAVTDPRAEGASTE
jgi:signal transduction histidine kinase/ActR/RegA family two-component response regulator